MKVTINGKEHVFTRELSISALVRELRIDVKKVAIEKNLSIIPYSEYENMMLNEGDNLEIVSFIGGG